jgi:hypothetical protein
MTRSPPCPDSLTGLWAFPACKLRSTSLYQVDEEEEEEEDEEEEGFILGWTGTRYPSHIAFQPGKRGSYKMMAP